MSKKNENAKKATWEKLNAETDESIANESIVKEEALTAKKSEPSSTQLDRPSYAALEELLQKTKTQLEEEHKSKLVQYKEYKEQNAYQLAEMENIRRRCKADIESAYKFSLEKIIKELLPIKDSLEAALASKKEANDDLTLKEGVQLTLQALKKVLENHGVKAIEATLGQVFDPEQHEAMLTEISTDQDPNTILRVLQKGYRLYGRLIRPALVAVAKAPEENSDSG